MATPAQLDQMRSARGTDADRLFLTLMIAHHRGGVAMADAVLTVPNSLRSAGSPKPSPPPNAPRSNR